jgi:hypothetical protein
MKVHLVLAILYTIVTFATCASKYVLELQAAAKYNSLYLSTIVTKTPTYNVQSKKLCPHCLPILYPPLHSAQLILI